MTVGVLMRALAEALTPEQQEGLTASMALATPCAAVAYDSRHCEPGSIFVALRGLKSNGEDFAPEAVAAGAAVVIAETQPSSETTVPWVVVPDARLALAHLASEFFGHPSREMRVIGITGTNGKTTTSYLLRQIFEAAGIQCGLMGTVSYRVGDQEIQAVRTTPEAPELQDLMRQMVAAGSGACAMEVSSHALALRRVHGVHFSAGVFTNLTRDHLDFHVNMEDYFAAKRQLFELLPSDAPAVVNLDDPRGDALKGITGHSITYAISRPADVHPGPLSFSLSGLEFDVRSPVGVTHVKSKLVGRPNVYNILAAIAAADALGLPHDAISRGLERLESVPGRFEQVSSPKDDITVIVDYAHTDDALRNLLETARSLARHRLLTVFGAGGDRDRTKRPLMGMVAARLSDVVIITSDNARSEDPAGIIEEIRRGADPETRQRGAEVLTVVERSAAIYCAVDRAAAGDLVLVAGKGHEKRQEVGGQSFEFDDVAVARAALEARREKSRVG